MKKFKYSHRITAIFSSGQGVFKILNDTKKFETETSLRELEDFIIKENNLKSATISNIFTVINK